MPEVSKMEAIHRHKKSKSLPGPGPKQQLEHTRRPSPRAQCLLAPRSYEEIYHERAYLTTYLQQKTRRIEGLVKEYSEAEAQLNAGAEGKARRRLRKLQNLLRCKLDEASEQERAIFSRMGELYMELSSRDTWERSRTTQSAASFAGIPGGENVVPPVTPCPSFASSEWSVTSSFLESPVSVSDLRFPDAEVQLCQDDCTLSPSLGSDYLETVLEEAEKTSKTPTSAKRETADENTPSWHSLNQEPEVGTLEYDYAYYEDSDNGETHGSDSERCRNVSKIRKNRLSLPVMQFVWPDA